MQSRRRQPYDAVAQRRNLLHLHFAFGADEEQFHPVAAAALKCFGHCDGRIDVAPVPPPERMMRFIISFLSVKIVFFLFILRQRSVFDPFAGSVHQLLQRFEFPDYDIIVIAGNELFCVGAE